MAEERRRGGRSFISAAHSAARSPHPLACRTLEQVRRLVAPRPLQGRALAGRSLALTAIPSLSILSLLSLDLSKGELWLSLARSCWHPLSLSSLSSLSSLAPLASSLSFAAGMRARSLSLALARSHRISFPSHSLRASDCYFCFPAPPTQHVLPCPPSHAETTACNASALSYTVC